MTEKKNTPPNPAAVPPYGLSPLHPLTQAGAALDLCLRPLAGTLSREESLHHLAELLENAVCTEGIECLADHAVMLAGQARVLDAAFNRLIMDTFAPGRSPNRDYVRSAFMAQRQCVHTIDRLEERKNNNGKKVTERNKGR